MRRIFVFLLAITLLMGCFADNVQASQNDTISVSTSAIESKFGKAYRYESYDSLNDEREATNVYPVKIKKFYPNYYFKKHKDTMDFVLDFDSKKSRNLFFKITLYDGSVYVKNAYFKNQSGVYCVPFGNRFEEDKKDVNAKIFDDMWEGISKAEVFYVENESFGCGASFIEWIRTLDSGCAQYHMPNFFVNHGKPSKHKVKFSWDNKKNGITDSAIYYEVYVCSLRDEEKCRLSGKCKCGNGVFFCDRHFKKITTTKKTSYTVTKLHGKKLDIEKEGQITMAVRAKKKIDGKWIKSDYCEESADAYYINH